MVEYNETENKYWECIYYEWQTGTNQEACEHGLERQREHNRNIQVVRAKEGSTARCMHLVRRSIGPRVFLD